MSEHEEQVSSYIPSDTPTAPPTEETNGFEHVEQQEIENAVDTVLNSVTKSEEAAPASAPETKGAEEKKICGACPYSFLGGSCLTKMLNMNNLPPHVRDLVLWRCPKKNRSCFWYSICSSSFSCMLFINDSCFFTIIIGHVCFWFVPFLFVCTLSY